MIVVSVMYPQQDSSRFDLQYYLEKHLPLIEEKLGPAGLEEVRALHGVGAPNGQAASHTVIGLLSFKSLEAFQAGIAQHGPAIFADRPNFTDIQPVFQINEVVR